jgi:hypothetical protein
LRGELRSEAEESRCRVRLAGGAGLAEEEVALRERP